MNTKTISQQIKECLENKDKATIGFNKEMTYIVTSMANKNRKDETINEIKDKYMTAKTENPDCIIIYAGPYFWKYREKIKLGDLNPLLDSDFREEITEIQDTLPDYSNMDRIQTIMNTVKRSWHLLAPLEQETLKKKFKLMVAHYATYVGAEKKMKELKKIDKN